jgi:hypothetical protein
MKATGCSQNPPSRPIEAHATPEIAEEQIFFSVRVGLFYDGAFISDWHAKCLPFGVNPPSAVLLALRRPSRKPARH